MSQSCDNPGCGRDFPVFDFLSAPFVRKLPLLPWEGRLTKYEISAVSYAYPAVPGDGRADVMSALGVVDTALARVDAAGFPAFVLSTCLRVEIAVPAPMVELDEVLTLIFGKVPTPEGAVRRTGTEAVEHLFRIVAGLESPVVGEREILVQFRQAVATAARNGATNGVFRGLLDAAIATARSVRKELPVDPRSSLASIAAGLTEQADRVGVLGYGAMGRSVAEALLALPHGPTVEVFVRRPGSIDNDRVIIRSLSEASSALLTLPAVISATSAKTRLIPAGALADLIGSRTESLTLIDMAMPPDFLPPDGADVRYHDIDDLADRASDHLPRERVGRMVAEAAAAFMRKIEIGRRTGNLIEHLFDEADDVVAEAVERFAGKLTSPNDRALLEQTVHTAVRKILHGPVRYLSGDGAGEAAILAAAFGIDIGD